MNMIARVPAATPTEQDPRWQDVVARNKDADGRFFYSVKTTGVYCRPSCAARQAKPENVRFHATTADAEARRLSSLQALQADGSLAHAALADARHRSLPPH